MGSRLIVVGAGDFARELIGWIVQAHPQKPAETQFCFVDDAVDAMTAGGVQLQCLGTIADLVPQPGDETYLAIAKPHLRCRIADDLIDRGCQFSSFVHPTAVITPTARMGIGCILCPFSLLDENVELGNFVIVNCYSCIGHDSVIASCVTLSAHVDVTGHCTVESEVFFGSGARVLPGRRIGARAVVGAGAVAARPVPSGRTLYAIPSRLL